MVPPFPFSAIVGQEALKRALLLGVIEPKLGGVLIRGTKGVAKSTAVRALAALLPPIATVVGCPFQRRPGEDIPDWPLPAGAAIVSRPAPLVELPLGATEDRVLGSLHLEKALRGERAFEPGLLAAANRGLLYIDEVNLLPDHLVDCLLDVSASGTHRVEREGLSLSHPARFVLVGTMNPEEGDLRPQLLDRFGLVVDVADLDDPAQRAEAVRRRLAYEADPEAFANAWREADAAEAQRLRAAQDRLPQVQISDSVLSAISERCLAAGVEGLRADLTLCKAAAAWAAYQGRTMVEPADVEAVAELALVHRRTRPPEPPGEGTREKGRGAKEKGAGGRGQGTGNLSEPQRQREPLLSEPERQRGMPLAGAQARTGVETPSRSLMHFTSAGLFSAQVQPAREGLRHGSERGRWRGGAGHGARSGAATSVLRPAAAVAWAATLRSAAPHQIGRGRSGQQPRLLLQGSDLRFWPPRGPAGCLLLFVLDASGSMAAWKRMRQTKAAVLALVLQAYQHRDRVALLAFRGSGAELVLPPTRGLGRARQALEELAVGGSTPLAHGLAAARDLVRRQQRRQPRQPIWTVLLTDGRTNVPMADCRVQRADSSHAARRSPQAAIADAWADALAQGRALAATGCDCLVVDTETGWPRFGRARFLAEALGAECLPLEKVLGRPLADRWRGRTA